MQRHAAPPAPAGVDRPLGPKAAPESPLRLAAFGVCLALATWAALLPGDAVSGLTWPDGRPISDKLLHAAAFAALGCAAGVLVRRALWTLVGLMLFGIGIEWLQAIGGAGRAGDVRDAIANGVGLVAALFVIIAARWAARWASAGVSRRPSPLL